MKMGKFGYWMMSEIKEAAKSVVSEAGNEAPEETGMTDISEPSYHPEKQEERKLLGKCTLSIRFENHGDYLRWKKYFGGGRQWEFLTAYPAIMRAGFTFHNSLEAEVLAKNIVRLLEAGFAVYSANWTLEPEDEKIAKETTP